MTNHTSRAWIPDWDASPVAEPSRRRHARQAPAGPTHRLHRWHPEQTYARWLSVLL